jgi:hypothetical protein
MIAKEHFEYIDDRFEQLITESKDVAEKAAHLLFLANAGGAAATLTFIGAVAGYGSNGHQRPHSSYLSLVLSSPAATWQFESTMSIGFSQPFSVM